VEEDIEPYICVFPKCPTEDAMYASSEDWIQHMKDHHAKRRWICPICDPEERFNSVPDFYIHMRSNEDHKEEITESQFPILAGLCSHQMPLEFDECPLCSYSDANREKGDKSQQDHISEHIQAFALMSLPWEDGFSVSDGYLTVTDLAEQKTNSNVSSTQAFEHLETEGSSSAVDSWQFLFEELNKLKMFNSDMYNTLRFPVRDLNFSRAWDLMSMAEITASTVTEEIAEIINHSAVLIRRIWEIYTSFEPELDDMIHGRGLNASEQIDVEYETLYLLLQSVEARAINGRYYGAISDELASNQSECGSFTDIEGSPRAGHNSSHNHTLSSLQPTSNLPSWLQASWLNIPHRHERIALGLTSMGMSILTREMMEMHANQTADIRGLPDCLPVAGRTGTKFIGWRQKLGTWPRYSRAHEPVVLRISG
jgi:hypothetical protein